QSSAAGHSQVSGALTGLAGACPNLTFSVSGTTVSTDATTSFGAGGCAAALNGSHVTVQGSLQGDGSMLAGQIVIDQPAPPRDVSGVIQGLSGGCPNLSFTVSGTLVKTDARTTFDGLPCPSVGNGQQAEVTGTVQASGEVQAARVSVSDNGTGAGRAPE